MGRFSLFLTALVAIGSFGNDAQALGRRNKKTCASQTSVTSSYQSSYSYQSSSCANGSCPLVVPAADPFSPPATVPPAEKKISVEETEALSEVNALRAQRGLRPYIFDPLLTEGARRIATVRAQNRIFGHLPNDFSLLPQGASAAATGCAAYPPSYGWMSCAVYDNYTYAGAAFVMGADGKRYMHLVVR